MSVSLSLRDAIYHLIRAIRIGTNGPTTGGRYGTVAAMPIGIADMRSYKRRQNQSVQLSLETIALP